MARLDIDNKIILLNNFIWEDYVFFEGDNMIKFDKSLETGNDFQENKESKIKENNKVTSNEYSKEELKQLYDDFAGYVSDKVKYEYDGKNYEDIKEASQYGKEYIETGLHKVSWSKDADDKTRRKITLNPGTVLIQYQHSKSPGKYFADENEKYENLQLYDSQDKRKLNRYEVIKDFEVEESIIEKQYFGDETLDKKTIQYFSDQNANELVKLGILRKIK